MIFQSVRTYCLDLRFPTLHENLIRRNTNLSGTNESLYDVHIVCKVNYRDKQGEKLAATLSQRYADYKRRNIIANLSALLIQIAVTILYQFVKHWLLFTKTCSRLLLFNERMDYSNRINIASAQRYYEPAECCRKAGSERKI